jgi:hypothetical protein
VRRHALWLVSLLLLAGCPDSNKSSEGDAANVTSGVPMSGKIQKKPKDPASRPAETPKEESFKREVLVELYRAEQLSDDKGASVKRKHGLVDVKGNEIAARVAEYEAALQRFATEHQDEWSKLVDEIEAAKVTSAKAGDVQKK